MKQCRPYVFDTLNCVSVAQARHQFQADNSGNQPKVLIASPHTWACLQNLTDFKNWYSQPPSDIHAIEPLGACAGVFMDMQVFIARTTIKEILIIGTAQVLGHAESGQTTRYTAKLLNAVYLVSHRVGWDQQAIENQVKKLQGAL